MRPTRDILLVRQCQVINIRSITFRHEGNGVRIRKLVGLPDGPARNLGINNISTGSEKYTSRSSTFIFGRRAAMETHS